MSFSSTLEYDKQSLKCNHISHLIYVGNPEGNEFRFLPPSKFVTSILIYMEFKILNLSGYRILLLQDEEF